MPIASPPVSQPPGTEVPTGDSKRSYVRGMFTAIAGRYDLLNRVLSLGIDQRWRRRAVERLAWRAAPNGVYLDLCAGTLDLSAELASQPGFGGRVVGTDFVVPMLRLGRGKAAGLVPVGGDALELPFPDGTFDGCMIGFGIRNLADLDRGLAEMARVLKPGGTLVVLEFATPNSRSVRSLYLTYFRWVLPLIGRLVSRHQTAYSYLRDSVLRFPSSDWLAERVATAGFQDVTFDSLSLGIAAIYRARRR